jgi:Protein of unknown function (DUF2933)
MEHEHPHPEGTNRLQIVSRFVFFGFAAIALFFLITEHRAHLFGVLPFLLLAACPLMHLFHHGGHKHGGGDSSASKPPGPDGGHQHG